MNETWKRRVRIESIQFLYLFLAGIAALPIVIYAIGSLLFGDYGGSGFSAFYGSLHRGLRSGEMPGWFLVLAPYIVWQLVRGTLYLQKRLKQEN